MKAGQYTRPHCAGTPFTTYFIKFSRTAVWGFFCTGIAMNTRRSVNGMDLAFLQDNVSSVDCCWLVATAARLQL